MSRFRRNAFAGLAILCGALLVLTAGAWVVAAFGMERSFESRGRVWQVGLHHDHFWVTSVGGWPAGTLAPGERVFFWSTKGSPKHWDAIGCWGDYGTMDASIGRGRFTHHGPYSNVGVDLWLPLVLSAPAPAAWLAMRLRRAYRKRRTKAGFCIRCGYDLHGNVSGVCPECGTPVAAAVGA